MYFMECRFALACTVGLFREFGELFSDVFLGTPIRKSLHEALLDLVADAVGAGVSLAISWFCGGEGR